ncbi:MAG TPA: ABC transporter substrate-binding protein [Gaiellaceae bacterium]|jgi:NitT/TauT family transport system substrate-binding protein
MKGLVLGRPARIAAVLAAAAALLASAATASATPTVHASKKADSLVIGLPGIPPVFLGVRPYVALQLGYYKKWGVDVTLKGFTTGTDAVRAVQAGQIDAAWSPTPFALTLISKGVPLVGIEGMDKVDWLVGVNSSSIKTCSDLKGQNIGVDSIGGARYAALQAMLSKCNLTIQDVKPIVLPGNTAVAAMLAGQIHASVLHLDDLAEASKQGEPVRKLLTLTQVDPFQSYDMLVATKDTVAAKRAALVKMIAADIAATKYMNNPKALDKIAQVATISGHDPAVSKVALKQYLALKWWPADRSGLGIASITRTIFENVKLGNISNGNPPKWKDVVDTSLWKQAFAMVSKKK